MLNQKLAATYIVIKGRANSVEFLGNDRSNPISKPSSSEQGYYDVPNRRVRSFVGREDILSRIDAAFLTGQGPRIAVLQGMGGQGKSQVALEYCHRKRNDPYSAIFWVDATTEDTVIGSFRFISERLRTPEDNLPDSPARIAFVLRTLSFRSTSWLIVFDNYDSPDAFSNILDYFPEGVLGTILVTGRHAHLSSLVIGNSANYVEMPGLDKDAALSLLINQSETKDSNTLDSDNIVQRLGFHPLALTQAAAYIREQKISLSKFLEKYGRQRRLILENTPMISQYRKRIGDAEKETSLNVFTTWELSLQQLRSSATHHEVEETLLNLLAFFNEQDISEELFSVTSKMVPTDPKSHTGLRTYAIFKRLSSFTDHNSQWDSDLFKNVLIRLKNLCLLQSFAEEPDGYYHVSLHPLVKDWIQLRMNKSDYQKNVQAAAAILAKAVDHFTPDDPSALRFYARQTLSVHIMAQEENCVILFEPQPATRLDRAHQDLYLHHLSLFVRFLLIIGSYRAVESLNRRFLVLGETYLGPENPLLMVIQHNMAKILVFQKRWGDAEKLYLQVIDTRKKVLGFEHIDTLNSMNGLAETYCGQKRWSDGEKLYLQVIETKTNVMGPEHKDTLSSMYQLGMAYFKRGSFRDAETLFLKLLKICKGPLKVERASHSQPILFALRFIYQKLGQPEMANDLPLQGLKMGTPSTESDSPPQISSFLDMTILPSYLEQGRWEDAVPLLLQSLETGKRLLGRDHPSVLDLMAMTAHFYKACDVNDDAVDLMKTVVELRAEALGPDHPDTLEAAEELSSWKRNQNSPHPSPITASSHRHTLTPSTNPNGLVTYAKSLEGQRHSLSDNRRSSFP